MKRGKEVLLLEAMEEKRLYKFKKACVIRQQERQITLKDNAIVYKIGNKLYELK